MTKNKYSKTVALMMTIQERKILEKLSKKFKGSNSQILRLGLSKLAEEMKIK